MCTVSWWRGDSDAFGVFFNRDERRTRPASQPVRAARSAEGIAFLAPRDPAAGGTWLLANTRGLIVGVLNHYAATTATPGGEEQSKRAPARRSRGHLPIEMAGLDAVPQVGEKLAALDLAVFAPFVLVTWDPQQQAAWTWDGARLSTDFAPTPPITTSSFRGREVVRWRRERYRAIADAATPEALAAFHDDVAHADPAFNVRMRRSDARTESVCRVDVTHREVRFMHRREAPDSVAALDAYTAALPRT